MSSKPRQLVDFATRTRFASELKSLLRSGKSQREIASQLGVVRQTVARWMHPQPKNRMDVCRLDRVIENLRLSRPFILGKLPKRTNLHPEVSAIDHRIAKFEQRASEDMCATERTSAIEDIAVLVSRFFQIAQIPNELKITRKDRNVWIEILIDDDHLFPAACKMTLYGHSRVEYEWRTAAFNAQGASVQRRGELCGAAIRDLVKYLLRQAHLTRKHRPSTAAAFGEQADDVLAGQYQNQLSHLHVHRQSPDLSAA